MNTETKQLKVELIYETKDQRFYKLNHKINVAPNMFGKKNASIQDDIERYKHRVKPECQHLIPKDGVEIICVSDAHTHTERIVFAAVICDNGLPGRLHTQLDGYNTFLIHGGDHDAIYPDYVYIRRIAKANGLVFHYKSFEQKLINQ